MTKFEEEFNALTSWDWVNADLIQQILTRFGNWHSDEEFQAKEKEIKRLRKINHLYKKAKGNAERMAVDRGERLNQAQDEIAYLKSQFQQQALPVVPECVAEWIEILKTKGLKPLKNPETYGETGFTEEKLQNIVFWISERQEDYMRAWLDGYTVEKPQLFYLKHIDFCKTDRHYDWFTIKHSDGPLNHLRVEKGQKPSTIDCKFTQQEIDSMQTGSYELVPVEDGE
ncbi:DUF1642 domain-containing protein [Lactococcus lactis]|uniref:DUF1642 domain-containing protein n=1 Tax=Lactococcus lactis TaxID=1358 RepID=UPI000BA55A57|nr:DUF1642 domain-containing protein [Lactococcus lactis]PAK65890.1 hypothetical protein B8W94_13600 [Lactococcus lactis]